MKGISTVAIVKVENGDIYGSLERLISLIGGLESVIVPFDNVLIKPNWVTDKDYTTGAVTHPELIKACVKMALNSCAKKVVVGDSSIIGKNTEDAIERSGINSIASKRVQIVDFKKSEQVSVAVPNAALYRRLSFPKEVWESDVIINLPVMKTHDILPVTLGFKNMKGLVTDKLKRRIHTRGIEEALIDINRVVLADLTIIDGIVGMEGNGPIHGTPVEMNVLIASFDPLAAEVTAIRAMGFDPGKIHYIQMAYEAGFGEKDAEKISIVGERLENIRRNFKTNYYSEKTYEDKGIVIEDSQACSACRNSIVAFLSEDMNISPQNSGDKILIAAGSEAKKKFGCRRGMAVGNCMIKSKDLYDEFVPGCPPLKRNISSAYRKMIGKD